MDEILFETKFVRDKSTAKEVYGYYFFRRPLMIVMYVVIGVYALGGIIGLIFDFENAKEMILPILLLVFAGVMMIVSYNSQVKSMVVRDKEMAKGDNFWVEVKVSDSEIGITSLVGSQSVGLDGVRYAFVTKNYVGVVTKAKFLYILKKDSFTKGDAEGFTAFLRGKGIKIKK